MSSDEMRLVIAIVRDADSEAILQALLEAGFRVTRIASADGFLRRGHAALLIGMQAEKVRAAIQIMREHSAPAIDPGLKRATIFVLKTDRFEQI